VSDYKKFKVTVVGELLDGQVVTHEFLFMNPKHVGMSRTAGYMTSKAGGSLHYERDGHGTFEIKVET
jgi:hypothetical protein